MAGMPTPEARYTQARLIAWFCWLVVGVEQALALTSGNREISLRSVWIWVAAYFGFMPALYIPGAGHRWADSVAYQRARLVLATAAPLLMVYADPRSFACALLVIVAWELALALPMRVALPWIALQTIAVTMLLTLGLPVSYVLPEVGIYLGFEGYAVITAHLARSETAARGRLADALADLRATQSLLTYSARTAERLRIARELHDLIGHHMAALVMNLEVAQHRPEGAQTHIVKAQHLARTVLGDVRNTVKLMRPDEPTDLRALLEQIASDIPGLDIHFAIAADATAASYDRIQVLVRIVQEATTNAIRHSACRNVWIDITKNGDLLRIAVRDDGHGARAITWGSGLRGMQERLQELGGSLTVLPNASPGFSLTALLPNSATEVR
jgi:signal transduction histidine kinase